MAYFIFNRLINKYSRPFKITTKRDGYYDGRGEYKYTGDIVTEYKGAIIGLTQKKIQQSDGNYTVMDKMLYMLNPLNPNEIHLGTVEFNGKEYTISEEHSEDNAVFTGVYIYLLKYNKDRSVADDTDRRDTNSNINGT